MPSWLAKPVLGSSPQRVGEARIDRPRVAGAILLVYTIAPRLFMSGTGVAKLFRNGRSQAVRLPRAFRFPGHRRGVRRVPGGILFAPWIAEPPQWFAEQDRLAAVAA